MANWYVGRRAVKLATGLNGVEKDSAVDRIIEAQSRAIDNLTRTFFIPKTETRLYRWSPRQPSRSYVLWLDQHLISVSTLQSKAQDATPTTIAASDYFLEPVNLGPPYNRIEIDQSSTASFESGNTPQRSISVAGDWGHSSNTVSAGTVSSGLASDATATSMVCSNASLVDVGDTLLIESERVFVSNQTFAALGSILLDGALTASKSGETVTVDGSHGIVAGEVIRVDSEEMYVESVSTNALTVIRAWNGSTLAAHNDNAVVNINRTLTIERGVNGTTGATHANSTAMSVYEVPTPIRSLCLAMATRLVHEESSGYTGQVGRGDSRRQPAVPGSFDDYQSGVIAQYKRYLVGVV